MERVIKLIKRSSINITQLEGIRIGDFLCDEFGRSGVVNDIEKIQHKNEHHYYFNLGKVGTILIIL